jgi:hypothetical protein
MCSARAAPTLGGAVPRVAAFADLRRVAGQSSSMLDNPGRSLASPWPFLLSRMGRAV